MKRNRAIFRFIIAIFICILLFSCAEKYLIFLPIENSDNRYRIYQDDNLNINIIFYSQKWSAQRQFMQFELISYMEEMAINKIDISLNPLKDEYTKIQWIKIIHHVSLNNDIENPQFPIILKEKWILPIDYYINIKPWEIKVNSEYRLEIHLEYKINGEIKIINITKDYRCMYGERMVLI